MKFRRLNLISRSERVTPCRLPRPATCHPSPADERGVALVITLILLAVITFMAVTFLVISNSQKQAAGTAQQQTVARNAAAQAQERFVADLVARIMATSNAYNAGLFVSTNFLNPDGFDSGAPFNPLTNVNFFYKQNGAALSAVEMNRNLFNLLYDPTVPVYVVTNRSTGAEEFRFYLDVNRNGRFDTNGMLAERDFNGLLIATTNGYRSNYFVGDPQWIGVLERPEFPHSPSNRFIARFCYVAVPIGNALDVNYIHNQAYDPLKAQMKISGEDFFRNQGVGPWEINLAAFLTDLNSNAWPGFLASYNYNPTNPFPKPASGTTFEDAFRIYSYRLNGLNYNLSSVSQIYGPPGAASFQFDQRDGYTAAQIPNLSPSGYAGDPDFGGGRVGLPWPGSENPNHIFSLQDWFNRARLGRVADKLTWLATSNSTYDNTTFMRLQEQLGTDSAPDTGKLNLNYANIGRLRETNFVSWHDLNVGAKIDPVRLAGVPGPLIFFTNAANRILRAQPEFKFGVTDIPVWSNGVSFYTPAIHRCLQLAANLYEASTNSRYPLVFRPRLTKNANGMVTISGYDEVSTDPSQLTAPMDIVGLPDNADNLASNVYGVPWIIGAKKWLPNLNEIGLATRAEITRKLLVTKPANATSPGPGWTTNLQYSMSISNAIAVEAWNSYASNYPGSVQLLIHGDLTMIVTNEFGVLSRNGVAMSNSLALLPPATNVINWSGYSGGAGVKSLVVPLSVGQLYLPTSVYQYPDKFTTLLTTGFDPRTDFPQPKWGITARLRLRFAMVDTSASPNRIIDCVQINESNRGFELAEAIRDDDKKEGLKGLWSTNLVNRAVPQGILNQVLISMTPNPPSDWKSFGKWGADGKGSAELEIEKFRKFMLGSPTNVVTQMQVPFSPTRIKLHKTSLQVNDPMVHYLASDLRDMTTVGTNAIEEIPLQFTGTYQVLKNIGYVNGRYAPWGAQGSSASGEVIEGFPDLYDIALKDPGVTNSTAWNFPTNSTYPHVGWMGRVHRGTPWQTVYLKANDIPPAELRRKWQNWTGNENPVDAAVAKPVNDRILFDLFTATVDENVTRGLLPVNQTNLAAWSAVFGGVVALSNSALATVTFPYVIAPVSVDGPNGPLGRIYAGITRTRSDTNLFPNRAFTRLGDVLATPELTDQSPFITTARTDKSEEAQRFRSGMTDGVYEWLPQQVMGLLKFSEPRYVVYAYGQSLKPAPGAVLTAGPFFGLCTNYQVTAEIAARSVIRVVNPNSPNPTIEQENYNLVRPD